MNRKNLTAAVLAGLAGVAGIAGTAQAVNMNPDGLGQVLVYPYYTANDGNSTILSVVNTTDNAKAIKVRFLEGFNSREVLDFNLYMSMHDVWVASISMVDGVPTLTVPDTSCTVPYLYLNENHQQEFLSLAYAGTNNDGGPDTIGRAAEGHFEMIEMGTLVGEAAANVTHDDSGVPANCLELTEYWTDYVGAGGTDGKWFAEAEAQADCDPYPAEGVPPIYTGCTAITDTQRNSGGIFGGAAVVNVENGTMYSYDAQALQGFDDQEHTSADRGLHYIPGTIFPSLNTGSVKTSWVFFGVPQNQAVDLAYTNTVDAVSSVFMHETVMNEYIVDADIGAATEWVVTFPTKNFYADWPRMVQGGLVNAADTPAARAPFTKLFAAETAAGDLDCEVVSLQTWDREEQTFVPELPGGIRPPVVSPSVPGGCDPAIQTCESTVFQLCNEVNVMRFGEESIFGTPDFDGMSLLLSVEDEFVSGWGRMELGTDPVTGKLRVDELGLVGLPVTGFAAQEFENNYLEGGVKANYGGLFKHKGNVKGVAVVSNAPTSAN